MSSDRVFVLILVSYGGILIVTTTVSNKWCTKKKVSKEDNEDWGWRKKSWYDQETVTSWTCITYHFREIYCLSPTGIHPSTPTPLYKTTKINKLQHISHHVPFDLIYLNFLLFFFYIKTSLEGCFFAVIFLVRLLSLIFPVLFH